MTKNMNGISYRSARLALARQAYATDAIRISDNSLTDANCLAATRNGLFAVGVNGARTLIHGLFFGITIDNGFVYIFETCDDTRSASNMGRILRFRLDRDRLCEPNILCKGLANGCHQIKIIDGQLVVVDTYQQLIQRYTLGGDNIDCFDPVPQFNAEGQYMPTQAHMNSVAAIGDKIHLMLHNGNAVPSIKSEVLVFDRQWTLTEKYQIDGYCCHDIVELEDGTLLYCGSDDGELLASNGLKLGLSGLMTRGLAYNMTHVMVGTTQFAPRESRDMVEGSVIYLDRSYQRVCEVPLHGAPTCIVSL